jgi:endonuclease/exonuclease/phosphatase family metal-dependent hydrolase
MMTKSGFIKGIMMATKKFTDAEWQKITALFNQSASDFGLPERRDKSVIIGTFNIRKLGKVDKRSEQSWALLKNIISRFDLLAIQEVMDDLSGLEHLCALLGDDYAMVVSDVTGVKPGEPGNPERLAFLYNWKRIKRTALASDITYDRSNIANNLYNNRADYNDAWVEHTSKLKAWKKKVAEKKAQGKRPPAKPPIELPHFVSFIRQPHYVSFQVLGGNGADPYEFLVVNAHLLYGKEKQEREWEFMALLDWLTVRAKQGNKLYHPNLLLLGDCNLDFDSKTTVMRNEIDARIKTLNKTVLKSKKAATANFPILTPHPTNGVIRTALRQKQTYDQIGLFSHDKRLPVPDDNATAGTKSDGYDYGVFNLADLIAKALYQKSITDITKQQQTAIFKKAEFDISDHMPVWMRLEKPN